MNTVFMLNTSWCKTLDTKTMFLSWDCKSDIFATCVRDTFDSHINCWDWQTFSEYDCFSTENDKCMFPRQWFTAVLVSHIKSNQ